MSILAIKSVTSALVEVKDETGAPSGVFFELAGPTHPKRKAIMLAQQRRLQQQLIKTGKMQLDDPAEQEQQTRENLAAFTLGWRGLTQPDGSPLPYSPEAARSLYENDEYAWLVDQLTAALTEKERFMRRSATS